MDTSIIIDFFKKAAKSLVAGVAGAVTSSDEVKLVPAIAPIPVSDVNEQYGRAEPVERPKEKEGGYKYEELVEERIKEVAFKKSMPYQPEVALFKGGLVKRETIAKIGEKEPEVVTPLNNYAESVELVYKQGAQVIISSSLGFLRTLPPSKGKASITTEANRLRNIFGIVNTPKPQKTIGLTSKLEWWGGSSSGGGMTGSGTGGGSKSRKMSKEEEEGGKGGVGGLGMLKNIALVGGAATLFGAGYYIPKMFPSTAKSKTDNNVEDFTKKKLLELTTDEKGDKKELSEYETILAERTALEKTREELVKEKEDKKNNRSGFTNFLKGGVFREFREIDTQIEKIDKELNKKRDDGKLYYYAIKSPKEQAESDAFDELLYGGRKEREQKLEDLDKNVDPFKHNINRHPIVLNPPTANAWEKAVNAAKQDGINLPRAVTSSYRSPIQQAALVDAAQKGKENIINPAAPGKSAHGQGWAVDIQPGKANEWMQKNGKKFGFEWQGEHDEVHFDFVNGEDNDKYLQPGNDSWIPPERKGPSTVTDIYKPQPGEISTKAALKSWRESNLNLEPVDTSGSVSTVNEEPVNLGISSATMVPNTQIITIPQTQFVPIPVYLEGEERKEHVQNSLTLIDPYGKGVKYEVVDEY